LGGLCWRRSSAPAGEGANSGSDPEHRQPQAKLWLHPADNSSIRRGCGTVEPIDSKPGAAVVICQFGLPIGTKNQEQCHRSTRQFFMAENQRA